MMGWGPGVEWGGPCGLAKFQDSVITSAFCSYTRKLEESSLAVLYMPETLLLCLECTVAYRPTGESQKELGAPVSLCLSLLVGWGVGLMGPESGVGEAQIVPRVETPMSRKHWVRSLPPGVLFSSGNLLLFLCGEAGRAGEWAAGKAGDPLGGGQKRLSSQPASSQR